MLSNSYMYKLRWLLKRKTPENPPELYYSTRVLFHIYSPSQRPPTLRNKVVTTRCFAFFRATWAGSARLGYVRPLDPFIWRRPFCHYTHLPQSSA